MKTTNQTPILSIEEHITNRYIDLATMHLFTDVNNLNVDGLKHAINLFAQHKPNFELEIFQTRFGLLSGKAITDEEEILRRCGLQNGIPVKPLVSIPGLMSATLEIKVAPIISNWLNGLTDINYLIYYNSASSELLDEYFLDLVDIPAEYMLNKITLVCTVLRLTIVPDNLRINSTGLDNTLKNLSETEYNLINDFFGISKRVLDFDAILEKYECSEEEAIENLNRAFNTLLYNANKFVTF